MSEDESLLLELESSVENFDVEAAREVAKRVLEANIDPAETIEKALSKGLKEVGQRFERGELFIVHLISAAEAMKAAISVLEPKILETKTERKALGRIVIGTVKGDIHDIGKNLVSVMLTAGGFVVYDLGKDVPAARFIEKARQVGADVIGASALLTTSMPAQKELADAISKSGLKTKYIVGGAPVNEGWAREIDAHYAADATSAVGLVKRLIGVGG